VFRLVKDTHFDFMGYRNPLLAVSTALIVLSVAVLAVRGLNWGIEFTGGTELLIRCAEAPEIGAIRSKLERGGFSGASVTSIGDRADHEVYIRLASSAQPGAEGDPTGAVVQALRGELPPGKEDLNVVGEEPLARLLLGVQGMTEERAQVLARALVERRRERAIFTSVQEMADVEGMTPTVLAELAAATHAGPLAVRSQSYVGPAIGRELWGKALFAILGSLAGMLIYIWIRFQIIWGCAAVLALAHDTLITLGLFSLFGKEMSLPVVAAFLTLIGYSANDTVVVFDRIREILKVRAADDLGATINAAINQTLSRTVITSGLTFLTVLGLLLLGGPALNPFSFVLSVGIVVGTYSSIYIASPILVLWNSRLSGRREARDATGAAQTRAGKLTT
jgi:preprotein translocase subunit SecF